MDAEKIIKASVDGTASLATGYLATLVKDLRESWVQIQGQQAEIVERIGKVEKRLDAASKAFADLKAEVKPTLPDQTVRPDPVDHPA